MAASGWIATQTITHTITSIHTYRHRYITFISGAKFIAESKKHVSSPNNLISKNLNITVPSRWKEAKVVPASCIGYNSCSQSYYDNIDMLVFVDYAAED